MTDRRDSLRELLGEHLEKAQAEGIAEQKADAMFANPELRERMAEAAKLPVQLDRGAAVPSERAEHASAAVPVVAVPRTTARTVAIDDSIDPRLYSTEVQPRRAVRSSLGVAMPVALVALLLGSGVGWFARGAAMPGAPAVSAAAPPAAVPTPAPACPACPACPAVPPSADSPCPSVAAPSAPTRTTSPPPPVKSTAPPSASSAKPRIVQ